MSFFDDLPDTSRERASVWARWVNWRYAPPITITAVMLAVVVFVVGVGFTTGSDGKGADVIDGPGDTYGFHMLIDGRSIPCIDTGEAVTCDWSIQKTTGDE